jgi:hypothetical protein
MEESSDDRQDYFGYLTKIRPFLSASQTITVTEQANRSQPTAHSLDCLAGTAHSFQGV